MNYVWNQLSVHQELNKKNPELNTVVENLNDTIYKKSSEIT